MIRLKLEKKSKKNIILKIGLSKKKEEYNSIIRRVLFEGEEIKKGRKYNYIIPLKFLLPIINNVKDEDIVIEKNSLISYIEYSDEYDECYYYIDEINPDYMKKWRRCGCPPIYKITLDFDTNSAKKEVIFNKIKISLDS